MAKIVVAASPEPRAVLERVLAGHDLVCAETISQTVGFLADGRVDLIVCTVVFDESKMFELLRVVKAAPEWRSIPFVCARVRPHILRSQTSLEAAALTCRMLGADAFLDIADYPGDPEREMRSAI